jgi:hypothetical protein
MGKKVRFVEYFYGRQETILSAFDNLSGIGGNYRLLGDAILFEWLFVGGASQQPMFDPRSRLDNLGRRFSQPPGGDGGGDRCDLENMEIGGYLSWGVDDRIFIPVAHQKRGAIAAIAPAPQGKLFHHRFSWFGESLNPR